MATIIPIRDLKDTAAMSRMCHESEEPIYITKNGYGDMVLMSMEAYEKLVATLKTDTAIQEAEEAFAESGKLLDARESLANLRRKHFGEV